MIILPKFEGYRSKRYVCKFKQVLYSLQYFLYAWYRRIDKHLLSIELNKLSINFNFYIWYYKDKYIIILLYVDDLIIIGNNHEEINRI